jgi:hypothetical protein
MTEPLDLVIYNGLRAVILAELLQYGITPECVHLDMLICRTQVRNAWLRGEYARRKDAGEKKEAIYGSMEAETGMSRSMVEKICRGEK